MTADKISAGNWRFEHENGNNPRIVSDAIDPGTGEACVLADLKCAMRSIGDDPYSETMANAALFAASKDMLLTLEGLEASMSAILISDDRRNGPSALIPLWLEDIRASIHKANGNINL